MKLIMNSLKLRRLDSNERPLANGYEPNEHKQKKRIHKTNHEFSKVAEFDSNERPLANGYEPNERKKKESMK